jgi:hypothetical protein
MGDMSEEITPAIEALRRQRAVYMARVQKIDTALDALQALDEVLPDDSTRAELAVPLMGISDFHLPPLRSVPPGRPPKSVLTRVLELFEENPDGQFTVEAMLDQFSLRGEPITSARPQNALRTALSTAVQQGRIVRLNRGLYKLAHHRSLSTQPTRLDDIESG